MSLLASGEAAAASPSRPTLVSLIALLVLIAALFALFAGLVVSANRDTFLSLLNNQTEAAGLGKATPSLVFNFAFILIGYGLIHLAIAYGLWTGKNWARIVSLILSILGLISLLPALPFLPEVSVPVVLFAVFVLYYFTRRNVKAFFKS